jgi:tRNA(fMet)-specific endonuclease VapC
VVLVDTSIWIEFLDRFNPRIRRDLVDLLRRREVLTAGLILAELREGSKSRSQVREILEAMEPLRYVEVNRRDWLRAGEIASECAGRGHRLKIGDCLLAAIALRENCPIFTLDRDFERIPGLNLYHPRLV